MIVKLLQWLQQKWSILQFVPIIPGRAVGHTVFKVDRGKYVCYCWWTGVLKLFPQEETFLFVEEQKKLRVNIGKNASKHLAWLLVPSLLMPIALPLH